MKVKENAAVDAPYWAYLNKLQIDGRPFTLAGRGYQMEIMRYKTEDGKIKINEVIKKGSQTGATMGKAIEVTHGALHGLYPQGIIIYFPSKVAVEDFSGSRFKPWLTDNDILKKACKDIDSVHKRRIGKTVVSFLGCSGTTIIGGMAKDSTSVRSTPADWILLDERDLFDDEMATQVNQRLGNSAIRRRSDMGTPKLPDDGIDRLYCVVPETKILTSDLRWKQAGRLKIGEKLVGFDENRLEGNKTRRYRTTEVISCNRIERPCIKITFDDNNEVTVSEEHKWLIETTHGIKWRMAKDLHIGDKLYSIGMWEEGTTKEDGYISGIYDGEGHIHKSKPDSRKRRGVAATIGFSQKEGVVLERTRKILEDKGFTIKQYKYKNDPVAHLRIIGGMASKLRFMGIFRPRRLFQKASLLWENISVGNDMGYTSRPAVVKMEFVGNKGVIALGTTHKTFIANGLLSHNSKSDMRRWQVKCSCGKYTCMETDFPNCIGVKDGFGYAKCVHCGKELNRSDGLWVPDRPDEETVGYWCSQLLNPNRPLALVLKEYADPEKYDISEAEFQRTVMGNAYARADDVLRETEVLQCCSADYMRTEHPGPCAMGFDVGYPLIHVVIGHRIASDRYRLIKMARVADWGALHDLAQRFNVKTTVGDAMPESHKIREWAKSEAGEGNTVYPCYYTPHLKTFDSWGTDNIVKVNRTEIFDMTHRMVTSPGKMLIPRMCPEVKIFAHQMCMAAKFLETDKRGNASYHYRKIGSKDDHYRNAVNYFTLACKRVGIPESVSKHAKATTQDMSYKI